MTDHSELEADLTAQIAAAPDLEALDQLRVAALGKAGVISALLQCRHHPARLAALEMHVSSQARRPAFKGRVETVQRAIAPNERVLCAHFGT